MRSLLAPLVIGLVVSLAVVFGVQWSAVRSAIDAGMRGFIAEELAQDADELRGALVAQPEGGASLAIQHFDPAFIAPVSGRYFQIMLDGRIVLRSPSLGVQSLTVAPVARDQRALADAAGPNGQQLLLSASGYALDGRALTIAVAADVAPVERESTKLLLVYTRVSVLMFALLVVLQIVIVRLSLLPLRRVQADVTRLEQGEIDQLGEKVPAEVLPLVSEVNRLLALLAQRLQRSRESLGNLAHALKGPLTVLTHMAHDERIRAHPELGAQMSEQLLRLRERVDNELRRARVAGGRVPGKALALAAEIEALAATLRKLYGERGLDIICDIDPTIGFKGDREDLLELCGNLLDNACKWARSQVLVTARRGHGIVLHVEDDGPGCSPEDLQKLAQRGVRLDEGVEGHGLGLAIARNIATSYGATLTLGRSAALGGFEVAVRFPAR